MERRHLIEPQYLYLVSQRRDGWASRAKGRCGDTAPAAFEGLKSGSFSVRLADVLRNRKDIRDLQVKNSEKQRREPDIHGNVPKTEGVRRLITSLLGARELP